MPDPANMDLKTLGTPERCVADFCLIPVRTQFHSTQIFAEGLDMEYISDIFPSGGKKIDRHSYSVRIARSGGRAAIDETEWAELLDAFCGYYCRYVKLFEP